MTTTLSFAPLRAKTGSKAAREVKQYQRLLGASQPHVIQTEEDNEYYLKILEALDARTGELSPAEEKLVELLTVLIEDFEERHYALKRASPLEALRELMRANH